MSAWFPNNPAMIKWGSEVVQHYGGWDAVRAASKRDDRGVWIVPAKMLDRSERQHAQAGTPTKD